MISIDHEKCIGCGQCVADCFPNDIEIKDKKAVPHNEKCFSCGHCVAVCPVNAVTVQDHDMDEVIELCDISGKLDPQVYLNHMKSRRSIRRFKEQNLTKEQIEMILEVGRFSPTGGNCQRVAYTVVRENLTEIREMIIDHLKKMGDEMLAAGYNATFYPRKWQKMYDLYHTTGTDELFFDAGTVIVVSSDEAIASGIAAGHMESMIYAMDLGMLYSGFSKFAIETSEELRTALKIKDTYHVEAVLVVGYPDVTYRRTVPRHKADVVWE